MPHSMYVLLAAMHNSFLTAIKHSSRIYAFVCSLASYLPPLYNVEEQRCYLCLGTVSAALCLSTAFVFFIALLSLYQPTCCAAAHVVLHLLRSFAIIRLHNVSRNS